MIAILIIISVIFEAWMDGFHSRGKEWHLQKIGVILPLLFISFFYDSGIGWLITSFIFVRIGLFDILNNAFAKRKINYRGDNWWDKFVDKFNPPLIAELFGRAVFLFSGIMMTIQQL